MNLRRLGLLAPVLALAGLVGACSSDQPEASVVAPTTAEPTTTTTAPPVLSPLTGLPTADPFGELHPAVSVKMDNSPDARPQSGINNADIVYEMKVEGITRFALVFHSDLVEGVGPVRSARSSDIDLVAGLSTPLFAWSGANPGVTAEVLAAAREGVLTDVSFDAAEEFYYRARDRRAPHNLYMNLPPLMQARAPEGQGPPAPVFQYRTQGGTVGATATPAPGLSINYGNKQVVEYVWDAGRQGWDRFQVDERHPRSESATLDGGGVQVAPANVVVMFTEYGVSAVDSRSPRAITVGEGEAIVLTAGQAIRGRWVRPEPGQAARLVDAAGAPILLTPGRTWVALPETGSVVLPFDQIGADEMLAFKR